MYNKTTDKTEKSTMDGWFGGGVYICINMYILVIIYMRDMDDDDPGYRLLHTKTTDMAGEHLSPSGRCISSSSLLSILCKA